MSKRIYIIIVIPLLLLFGCSDKESEYKRLTKEFSIAYATTSNEIANEYSLSRTYYMHNPEECLELFRKAELKDEVDSLKEIALELVDAGTSHEDKLNASFLYDKAIDIEKAIEYSEKTELLTEDELEDLINIAERLAMFNDTVKEKLQLAWGMDASEVEGLGISE